MNYDQFIAALCVWREARGVQSPLALSAIYHVLLNRVRDSRYPNTLAEVVLQPKQFSSFNRGDANSTLFPHPHEVSGWKAWILIMDVVKDSLGSDPTHGATNYESCNPDQLPLWAVPDKMTTAIGPFRFYKL